MAIAYPAQVKRIVDSVLGGAGTTEPALRRAVAACARAAAGDPGEEDGTLPAELRGFVDRVARQAYRATDEDVAALAGAGYSEDQIFEVAVAAALGASLVRLESGLAAVRGGR
jgi:alkylhydroperoxidase family enzyme